MVSKQFEEDERRGTGMLTPTGESFHAAAAASAVAVQAAVIFARCGEKRAATLTVGLVRASADHGDLFSLFCF
jgi:hypothetical protein